MARSEQPAPGISPLAPRVSGENVEVRGLMVGTPMYGGLCHAGYLHGMMQLATTCHERKIPLATVTITNESLVQRARNTIVAHFLASTCSHLLFIDADIGFSADAVLRLLLHDREVVGGLYRKKSLDRTDFAFNPVAGEDGQIITCPRTGAIRAAHLGTGFLMIKRSVLLNLRFHNPGLRYRMAEGDGAPGPWRDELFLAFDCFRAEDGTYLSEDYGFCHRARQLGIHLWADPGIVLEHHGTACFAADPAPIFAPRPAEAA
jgi:hypothetical protein